MIRSRFAAGLAALALSGLGVVGLSAPALADHVCPNPPGHYPPGQCAVGKDNAGGVSDNTPVPGQPSRGQSKGHKAGSQGTVTGNSVPVFLGTFTANSAGVIDFTYTLPVNFPVGAHTIQVAGIAPSGTPLLNSFPITITAANAALGKKLAREAAGGGKGAAGGKGSPSVGGVQLPRTGTEIVGVTAAGIALVGVGGIALYAGRRRRSQGSAGSVGSAA